MSKQNTETGSGQVPPAFAFFTELFITHQLALNALNRVMPNKLHYSHFAAVSHLMRVGDGCSPLALAKAMQVTKATISNTLQVLQKQGFVSVRPNPDDRRGKLVYLTEQGTAFHQQAVAALASVFQEKMKDCESTDYEAAMPVMKKIRACLDQGR